VQLVDNNVQLKKIDSYLKRVKHKQQTNKAINMGVVKANSLDLSKVTFSDVKTDNHGRKMVYINQNNGKIMVQTPKMYAPNGIKRWRKKDALDNKDDKFEMELSFYGENGTDKNAEEIKEFHAKWKEFDELIKNKIIENSREWLSMPKLDMNTLETVMYTPMVKVAKDKEGNQLPYPSRIRAKIDREIDTNGNFSGRFLSNKKFKSEVMLFDETKTRIDMHEDIAEDCVPKGCQVVSILELVYLSLSKTTISTKWKLVQAKVFRNKDSITEYAMLDDEDEVEVDVTTNLVQDQDQDQVVGEDLDTDADEIEDAGVDDNESDENEITVQVTPAPVKKARAKRSVQA
jgi:hypothetical protein